MSLTAKQKRFAHEYAVDHNGAQAAIRAGYSERTAKQTASRMMANVAVKQLVAKLDAEKADDLGLEAREALAQVMELLREAKVQQPKIWKGKPVTYVDEAGEIQMVTQFRAGSVAARMAELLFKKAGFDVSHTAVDHTGEVVYTLTLDRDLSEEGEE